MADRSRTRSRTEPQPNLDDAVSHELYEPHPLRRVFLCVRVTTFSYALTPAAAAAARAASRQYCDRIRFRPANGKRVEQVRN